MIDTHSHILPGIDDGSKNFETSIAMLKQAEIAGVTDIVLTPHYLKGTKYSNGNVKKYELYQELKKRAEEAGIKVNLYIGNEIYVDADLPKMLAGYVGEKSDLMYEISTLNSTKYYLVELPVHAEDKSAKSTLMATVKMGFIPVIAHPERYFYVQDNMEILNDYLAMGCLLQGEILTVTGKYGKREEKTFKKLLLDGKIFCLASDAHKPEDYDFTVAMKKLQKIVRDPAKLEELLVTNPGKIISGK